MARKSFVFYDYWFDAMDAIADPSERWAFMRWVKAYATTGEERELPAHLLPLAMMIKPSIDETNNKYDRAVEQRQKAIEKRWKKGQDGTSANKTPKTMEKSKNNIRANTTEYEPIRPNTEVQTEIRANTGEYYNENENENVDLNSSDKSSELKSLPLKSPEGTEAAEAAGDGIEKFGLYQERVEKALANVPPEVEAVHYTVQYAWRLSEGMPGYALAVKQAIASGCTGFVLEEQIRKLGERYRPESDFQAFKTAMAIATLEREDAMLAVHEINRARSEPGLWKTIQDKIDYIKAHRKEIKSVAAFLSARQSNTKPK